MRLLLGIATLSLLSVPPLAVSQTVHYTLAPEVSGGDLTALRVEVRFRAGASGTTDFRWDDGWNGEHRLWQWTRHPAYAAGLRNGMKILERIEGEPDNALMPYALLVEDRGTKRTIRYLPQGAERISVQQMRIRQPDAAGCRRTLGGLSGVKPN